MAPSRIDRSLDGSSDQRVDISLPVSIAAICTLIVAVTICGCCKRGKKKGDQAAKGAEKSALAIKAGMADVSPSSAVAPMPPREKLAVGHVSTCAFGFAQALYRWCGTTNSRKTVFVFPSAIQVAFGPCFEVSKGLTRSQMAATMFPSATQKEIDKILKTLTAAISPAALNDRDGWRVATRLYAPKKRMEASCPEYRQSFDALNELGGKVMEMVPFEEVDLDDPGPVVDNLNVWARRNVNFMTRPLFENAEKKMKTLFLKKPDPRLILINICGFRCHLQHPLLAANVSTVGHPFLFYDGRKLVPNLPMMHTGEADEAKDYYYYHEDDEFQILRLPLRRGTKSEVELAMYILLPKERGGLRLLETRFRPDSFIKRVGSCVQPERVRIILPKMELESHNKNFVEAVKSLGAKSLTDPRLAELTMFAGGKDGKELADHKKKAVPMVTVSSKTKTSQESDAKPPKGRSAPSAATENACLTDVIHGGCFQLLDDEAEKMAELKDDIKTVAPTSSFGNMSSKRNRSRSVETVASSKTVETTPDSKTVETTPGSKTVEPSLRSKTASERSSSKSEKDSPSTKSASQSKSSKPSIFARLMGKSGKSKSEKSDKDQSVNQSVESRKSGKEDKKSQKSASAPDVSDAPCPICTRLESRGVHLQLKRFVADHPFIWIVAIEKPVLVPLVVGRFCGKK